MKRPRICGVVTCHDEAAIAGAAPVIDLFELRLDLVGPRWPETARLLTKPWIATNRLAAEGGKWWAVSLSALRNYCGRRRSAPPCGC
jgi:3-dehydroquinate dehydratase-1